MVTRASRPPRSPRRGREMLVAMAIVVLCTSAVWAVTAATIAMIGGGSRDPATRTLVIPRGTASLLGGGLRVPIPATMDLVAGDVLIVRNEDTVMHQLGSALIPAGGVERISFAKASVASFACDFHQARRFTLQVEPRGLDLRLTIVPTAILGPATGLVLFGVWAVVRRVDTD